MSKMSDAFLAMFLHVVCWPAMMMWRAYAIIVLWGWFVTPTFNVQPLSIYVTAGLLIVLHLILPIPRAPENEKGAVESWLNSVVAYGLLAPALAMGLGWIWKTLQWGLA